MPHVIVKPRRRKFAPTPLEAIAHRAFCAGWPSAMTTISVVKEVLSDAEGPSRETS